MLPRDSVSLEELDRADGGGRITSSSAVARAGTVHAAARLRRIARLDNRDERARGRGEVLAVLVRDPEHDTVGPSEANLHGVLASSARRVSVRSVELPSAEPQRLGTTHLLKHDTSLAAGVCARRVQVAQRQLGEKAVDCSPGGVPTAEGGLRVSDMSLSSPLPITESTHRLAYSMDSARGHGFP